MARVITDMELWSEVCRRVLTGEMSTRAACQHYGIHWQTLAKMLEHPEPSGYRLTQKRSSKLAPFLPIIDEILTTDRDVHRKQRHTAKRIFERLRDEHGYDGGTTIVKDAVRSWKQRNREVFLPLSHPPGEAQVDFGFADVWLDGALTKVALFVMTLPYSDAVFMQAFPRECTEVFLEGHKRAFEFFGGVPIRISYDNSMIAVSRITGSRDRTVTREFGRLKSHFLFGDHFCLVRRPNEKGHVERLLDFARRNFLVPVPRVDSLEILNAYLAESCRTDLERTLRGKRVRFFRVTEIITQLMEAREERDLLRARKQLAKLDLLILDQPGYVPATKVGSELLFDVVSTRLGGDVRKRMRPPGLVFARYVLSCAQQAGECWQQLSPIQFRKSTFIALWPAVRLSKPLRHNLCVSRVHHVERNEFSTG